MTCLFVVLSQPWTKWITFAKKDHKAILKSVRSPIYILRQKSPEKLILNLFFWFSYSPGFHVHGVVDDKSHNTRFFLPFLLVSEVLVVLVLPPTEVIFTFVSGLLMMLSRVRTLHRQRNKTFREKHCEIAKHKAWINHGYLWEIWIYCKNRN